MREGALSARALWEFTRLFASRAPSQVVYFILGIYAGVGVLVSMNGSSKAATKLANMPAPTAPDYLTPIPKLGIPVFGTDEWVKYCESGPNNFETWLMSPELKTA